jgi:hypothetical protein
VKVFLGGGRAVVRLHGHAEHDRTPRRAVGDVHDGAGERRGGPPRANAAADAGARARAYTPFPAKTIEKTFDRLVMQGSRSTLAAKADMTHAADKGAGDETLCSPPRW